MKNNDKSRRALTVTQILGVQQSKYTLKNLVAVGNPEQNGYTLNNINTPGGWGGGVLGLMFAGYVPLASESPYPILVYCLANYRPHFSNFLEKVIFAIPT